MSAFSAKLHVIIHAQVLAQLILSRALDSWNLFDPINFDPLLIEDFHGAPSKNVALDLIIIRGQPYGETARQLFKGHTLQ